MSVLLTHGKVSTDILASLFPSISSNQREDVIIHSQRMFFSCKTFAVTILQGRYDTVQQVGLLKQLKIRLSGSGAQSSR